jgi:hypothetical protein
VIHGDLRGGNKAGNYLTKYRGLHMFLF